MMSYFLLKFNGSLKDNYVQWLFLGILFSWHVMGWSLKCVMGRGMFERWIAWNGFNGFRCVI